MQLKRISKFISSIIAVNALCFVHTVNAATIDVIANQDVKLPALSTSQVKQLFFATGTPASGQVQVRYDQATDSQAYRHFYWTVAHLKPAEVALYWGRVGFARQQHQPEVISTAEGVLALVSATSGAVGYVTERDLAHSGMRGAVTVLAKIPVASTRSITHRKASSSLHLSQSVDSSAKAIEETGSVPVARRNNAGEARATQKEEGALWQALRNTFQLRALYRHPKVRHYTSYFQSHPGFVNRSLYASIPYMAYVYHACLRHGVPTEFALLPMLESGYNPFAHSAVGASGLWQMMPQTASLHHLSNSWWFDERLSVVSSTDAALSYLAQLHQRFHKHSQSWLLAAAAYNAGPSAIDRALTIQRRAGGKDFWSLDLPTETRRYVPKLLALAAIVDEQATSSRFVFPPLSGQSFFTEVRLSDQLAIPAISRFSHVSGNLIHYLNPGLKRNATEPDHAFSILLPPQGALALIEGVRQRQLSHAHHLSWHYHEAYPGESLATVAHNYHASAAMLADMNGLDDDSLFAHQGLLVPVSLMARYPTVTIVADETANKTHKTVGQRDRVSRPVDPYSIFSSSSRLPRVIHHQSVSPQRQLNSHAARAKLAVTQHHAMAKTRQVPPVSHAPKAANTTASSRLANLQKWFRSRVGSLYGGSKHNSSNREAYHNAPPTSNAATGHASHDQQHSPTHLSTKRAPVVTTHHRVAVLNPEHGSALALANTIKKRLASETAAGVSFLDEHVPGYYMTLKGLVSATHNQKNTAIQQRDKVTEKHAYKGIYFPHVAFHPSHFLFSLHANQPSLAPQHKETGSVTLLAESGGDHIAPSHSTLAASHDHPGILRAPFSRVLAWFHHQDSQVKRLQSTSVDRHAHTLHHAVRDKVESKAHHVAHPHKVFPRLSHWIHFRGNTDLSNKVVHPSHSSPQAQQEHQTNSRPYVTYWYIPHISFLHLSAGDHQDAHHKASLAKENTQKVKAEQVKVHAKAAAHTVSKPQVETKSHAPHWHIPHISLPHWSWGRHYQDAHQKASLAKENTQKVKAEQVKVHAKAAAHTVSKPQVETKSHALHWHVPGATFSRLSQWVHRQESKFHHAPHLVFYRNIFSANNLSASLGYSPLLANDAVLPQPMSTIAFRDTRSAQAQVSQPLHHYYTVGQCSAKNRHPSNLRLTKQSLPIFQVNLTSKEPHCTAGKVKSK